MKRPITPPREGPEPAPSAAAPTVTATEARNFPWAHILDVVYGDMALGAEWLCQVTSWKGRAGHTDVADLSDKAALHLYANRGNAFSADALAKFEAQRRVL